MKPALATLQPAPRRIERTQSVFQYQRQIGRSPCSASNPAPHDKSAPIMTVLIAGADANSV
ncbi:MAG: hypothetical protein ACRYGM_06000 [Janthinobacterium lividum]